MRLTKPNWQEARRFLELLTGTADPVVTWQVFDDKGENFELADIRHGKISGRQIQKWLIVKIKQGCGIYVAINKTDGAGRRRPNMQFARASAVDFDKSALPDKWPLHPTIIAQSSPGRHWAFWAIEPTEDFNEWSECQARLAAFYGGDASIIDPPRVCRVPGFDHQKREPFRSRIIAADEFDRYTLAEIADAHPCEFDAPAPRLEGGRSDEPEGGWDSPNDIERARTYLAEVEPPEEGNRNNEGYRVACVLNDFGISPELSEDLMNEIWNERLDDPLPDHEIRHVIKSAGRYKESAAGSKSVIAAEDEFDNDPTKNNVRTSDGNKQTKKKKSGLVSINASDITPRNIEFIWENRLALGVHTALAGIGGMAKSQVAYNVVATVTKGRKWPDGGRARKGRCIILSAEESAEDMIVPRLLAAGADLTKVEIIRATREADGKKRKFNLQADLQKLAAFCREKGDVLLIVFDPVSSYMGGDIDTHRNAAVRHVLDPITQLAEEVACCILSITHFNKGSSNQAIHRVMESAAFVNAPRASFGVFEDPEDPNAVLMLLLKTNMKKPDGLRYMIETKDVGRDPKTGKPINAPYIKWDNSPVTMTANDVVQVQTERKTPRLDQAKDLIEQELEGGPKSVAEVKGRADAECVTPATLRRALSELGIRAVPLKGSVPPKWVYRYQDEFEESSVT